MIDLVEPSQQNPEEPIIFENQYKPRKRKKIKRELLEHIPNPEFTVLSRDTPHPSSIFWNIEKIEKDSLYDTEKYKNKTRFSNLPKKAPKGNLPVTFHKKIKSSGYGTKPEALKYSKTKPKKKMESKYFVTRDFSASCPIEIPEETNFLHKNPTHTKPITKIKYSNNGALLASAGLDMTICVLKTPTFVDSYSTSSFSGHDSRVNSLDFSSKDEYLLSSSADKSVVMWSIDYKRGKKALVINRTNQSLPDDANNYKKKTFKENPEFTHEIK